MANPKVGVIFVSKSGNDTWDVSQTNNSMIMATKRIIQHKFFRTVNLREHKLHHEELFPAIHELHTFAAF